MGFGTLKYPAEIIDDYAREDLENRAIDCYTDFTSWDRFLPHNFDLFSFHIQGTQSFYSLAGWINDVGLEGSSNSKGDGPRDFISESGTTYIEIEPVYDVEMSCMDWTIWCVNLSCMCYFNPRDSQIASSHGSITEEDDHNKNDRRHEPKNRRKEKDDDWVEEDVIKEHLQDWYGSQSHPCVNAYLGRECKHSGARGRVCHTQRLHPRQRPPNITSDDGLASSSNSEPVQNAIEVTTPIHLFSMIASNKKIGRDFTVPTQLFRSIIEVTQREDFKTVPDNHIYHCLASYFKTQKMITNCCNNPDCKGVLAKDIIVAMSPIHFFSLLASGHKIGKDFSVPNDLFRAVIETTQRPDFSQMPDKHIYHSLSHYLKQQKLVNSCCANPNCKGVIVKQPFDEGQTREELVQSLLVSHPVEAQNYLSSNIHIFSTLRRFIHSQYTTELDLLSSTGIASENLSLFQAASSKFSALYPNIPCCPDLCGAKLSEGPCKAPVLRLAKRRAPDEVWDKVNIQDQIATTTLPRMRVRDYSWGNMLLSLFMLTFTVVVWYFPGWIEWQWYLSIMAYAVGFLLSTTVLTEVKQTFDDPKLAPLVAEVHRVAASQRTTLYSSPVGFQKERETFFMPHLISTLTFKRSWITSTFQSLNASQFWLDFASRLESRPWFLPVLLGLLSFPWSSVSSTTIVLIVIVNAAFAFRPSQNSKHSIMDLTTYLTLNSPEVMSTGMSAASYRAEIDNATRKLASVLIPACTVLGMRNGDNIINHTKNVCNISYLAMKNREEWFGHLNQFAPRNSNILSLALQAMGTLFGQKLMDSVFQNFQFPSVVAIVCLVFLDWIRIIMHLTGMIYFSRIAALSSMGLLILVLIYYLLTELLLVQFTGMPQPRQLLPCLQRGNSEDSLSTTGVPDSSDDVTSTSLTSTNGCSTLLIRMCRRLLSRFYTNESAQDTFGCARILQSIIDYLSNRSLRNGYEQSTREEMEYENPLLAFHASSSYSMMTPEYANLPFTRL